MTILVVGKREGFAELIVPFLEKKGHTLLSASNSVEFIVLARSEKPGLIIVDLDMPGKPSVEDSEKLERKLEGVSIPVIVVARVSHLKPCAKELATFLRRNTVAILQKPVDLEEIEKEIASVCGEKVEKADCLTDETLNRLVDGELTQEEVERAQRHLSRCWVCQRLYEKCQKADSFLRDLFRAAMRVRMGLSEECLSPEKLVAYSKDSLSVEERAEVEAHLAQCSYCVRELVALYSLMKQFDQEKPEPLGEEILNRLKQSVVELLRKAGSLICIKCFESIPPGSTTCPHCGAVIRRKVQGDSVSGPGGIADKRDRTSRSEIRENRD